MYTTTLVYTEPGIGVLLLASCPLRASCHFQDLVSTSDNLQYTFRPGVLQVLRILPGLVDSSRFMYTSRVWAMLVSRIVRNLLLSIPCVGAGVSYGPPGLAGWSELIWVFSQAE